MKKPFYHSDFKLGVLGGGQLGRMLIQDAININVSVHCIDPDPSAPCAELASSFKVGSLNDYDTVYNFGKDKDVVTIEIEHVNVDALEALEKEGVTVFPQPNILRMIQDKGLQKQFYAKHNIPTADFTIIENAAALSNGNVEFPIVQKMRKGGYDGKGVQVLKSEADLANAFDEPSILEKMVPFTKELSVIVARNEQGQIATYPVVDMEFNAEANLVEFLFSPADITEEIEQKATIIAKQVAEATGMVGILAVELFLTSNGDILVNEMAPRPHNSGHQTIEGNITSQYEQHLRAILNLPLGSTAITKPSVMVNLLGEKNHTGEVYYQGLTDVLSMEGVHVHLYGKNQTKPFRKMGHVTVTDNTVYRAKEKAKKVKETLKSTTR